MYYEHYPTRLWFLSGLNFSYVDVWSLHETRFFSFCKNTKIVRFNLQKWNHAMNSTQEFDIISWEMLFAKNNMTWHCEYPLTNFLRTYWLVLISTLLKKQHKTKNLFSSHSFLRIFSEFFIHFIVLYFRNGNYIFLPTWENTVLKNFEKILRTLWEENK